MHLENAYTFQLGLKCPHFMTKSKGTAFLYIWQQLSNCLSFGRVLQTVLDALGMQWACFWVSLRRRKGDQLNPTPWFKRPCSDYFLLWHWRSILEDLTFGLECFITHLKEKSHKTKSKKHEENTFFSFKSKSQCQFGIHTWQHQLRTEQCHSCLC